MTVETVDRIATMETRSASGGDICTLHWNTYTLAGLGDLAQMLERKVDEMHRQDDRPRHGQDDRLARDELENVVEELGQQLENLGRELQRVQRTLEESKR